MIEYCDCKSCGKVFKRRIRKGTAGRKPERCPQCRKKQNKANAQNRAYRRRRKNAGHCEGCGTQLLRPVPSGLCGFCEEEQAA